MEAFVAAMVGLLVPLMVQVLRKKTGDVSLNDTVAQAIVLLVSTLVAVGSMALFGELEFGGDLTGLITLVFAEATIIYKMFQTELDALLPQKNGA